MFYDNCISFFSENITPLFKTLGLDESIETQLQMNEVINYLPKYLKDKIFLCELGEDKL